jgi:DHA1 family bicyclomycin/chloramphenicol resistance-like MFS transporter
VAAVTLPFALYSFALALGMPSLTLLALDCYPGARGMASAMQAFIQLGFAALLTLFVVDWLDDVLLHLVAGAAAIWLFAAFVWFIGDRPGKR